MRRRVRKDFSGRFLVRIPMALHRTLAEQAMSDRISLNQYVLYLLSRGASLREFERFLKSVDDTVVEDLETVIESERLVDLTRIKLRLIDLVLKETKIEKPSGKLHLDGDLALNVEEHQNVLGVDGKIAKVETVYTATVKAKGSDEKVKFCALFYAEYQGMRPISKEITKSLATTRLSSYPGRVFRDLLDRLITNLGLRIKIA